MLYFQESNMFNLEFNLHLSAFEYVLCANANNNVQTKKNKTLFCPNKSDKAIITYKIN